MVDAKLSHNSMSTKFQKRHASSLCFRQRGVRIQMLAGSSLRRLQADLRLQGECRQLRRNFRYIDLR